MVSRTTTYSKLPLEPLQQLERGRDPDWPSGVSIVKVQLAALALQAVTHLCASAS